MVGGGKWYLRCFRFLFFVFFYYILGVRRVICMDQSIYIKKVYIKKKTLTHHK